MSHSKHCSEEQRALIKKLIGEGKTYKEVQTTIGCSAKMISSALKWKAKPERRGRKQKTGSKNSQIGKGSANDQLQDDQRQSQVTCEYCDS